MAVDIVHPGLRWPDRTLGWSAKLHRHIIDASAEDHPLHEAHAGDGLVYEAKDGRRHFRLIEKADDGLPDAWVVRVRGRSSVQVADEVENWMILLGRGGPGKEGTPPPMHSLIYWRPDLCRFSALKGADGLDCGHVTRTEYLLPLSTALEEDRILVVPDQEPEGEAETVDKGYVLPRLPSDATARVALINPAGSKARVIVRQHDDDDAEAPFVTTINANAERDSSLILRPHEGTWVETTDTALVRTFAVISAELLRASYAEKLAAGGVQ